MALVSCSLRSCLHSVSHHYGFFSYPNDFLMLLMVVSQFLGILCSKVAIVSHECKSSSFHPLDAIL